MLNWLKSLFKKHKSEHKGRKAVPPSELPLTEIEEKVRSHLRAHRPCSAQELKKICGTYNVGSVIRQLRRKGYVIETQQHSHKTTYLIRNRKCH